MKERIIIDNNQHLPRASYYVAKDGHYDVGTVNYATPETILNENRIIAVKEQVPENFSELKTLFLDKLKELNVMWFGDKFVENKSEEFWVKGILFKADKTLSIRDDNDNIRVIMTNIDYPLMWALIQTTLNIKSNHL